MLITNYNGTKVIGETTEDINAGIEQLIKREAEGQQAPLFINIMSPKKKKAAPKVKSALPDLSEQALVLSDPKYMFADEVTIDELIDFAKASRIAVRTMRAVERTISILKKEALLSISFREYAKENDLDEGMDAFTFGIHKALDVLYEQLREDQ